MTPIAIARDANALSAANFPENEVYHRQATLNDQRRSIERFTKPKPSSTAQDLLSIQPTQS
jgi:hypothetical protein